MKAMAQGQTLAKASTFQGSEEEKKGKYIYCIIRTDGGRAYDLIGIGDPGAGIETFCSDGLGVIISDSPVKKYPINRKNTICHQKVMEEVMKYHTVLPVRFSTIAEDKEPGDGSPGMPALERIRQRVLMERRQEFLNLEKEMSTKVELGVKALWTDMKRTFSEVVEENASIRSLKEKVERINITNPRQRTHRERVKLGEMVRSALDAKREKLKKIIMAVLEKQSCDTRVNKDFGDNMIVNGAFLVEKAKVDDFENNLEKLNTTYEGRIKFKYVGPMPPCNFVEIVITWE